MSNQRLIRIERLVAVRQRQLEAVRDELARAQRDLNHAAKEAQQAEDAWREGSDALRNQTGTISEIMDGRNYIRSLRSRADHRQQELTQATEAFELRQRAVQQAHREVRKLEIWSEKVSEQLRNQRSRRERKQDDALAARMAAGSQR